MNLSAAGKAKRPSRADTAERVLRAIAKAAGPAGAVVLTNGQLAGLAGLSPEYLRTIVQALEAAGRIRRERDPDPFGRVNPVRYVLVRAA